MLCLPNSFALRSAAARSSARDVAHASATGDVAILDQERSGVRRRSAEVQHGHANERNLPPGYDRADRAMLSRGGESPPRCGRPSAWFHLLKCDVVVDYDSDARERHTQVRFDRLWLEIAMHEHQRRLCDVSPDAIDDVPAETLRPDSSAAVTQRNPSGRPLNADPHSRSWARRVQSLRDALDERGVCAPMGTDSVIGCHSLGFLSLRASGHDPESVATTEHAMGGRRVSAQPRRARLGDRWLTMLRVPATAPRQSTQLALALRTPKQHPARRPIRCRSLRWTPSARHRAWRADLAASPRIVVRTVQCGRRARSSSTNAR